MATNTLNQGFIYLQSVKGLSKGKDFPETEEKLYGALYDSGLYFVTRTNYSCMKKA